MYACRYSPQVGTKSWSAYMLTRIYDEGMHMHMHMLASNWAKSCSVEPSISSASVMPRGGAKTRGASEA